MVRNTRRQSSNITSTLKDYLVPIIGWVLILILLYSFFNGTDTSSSTLTSENKSPTTLTFGSPETEAYIVYPGDVKEKITEASALYKGETLIVKEGTIHLTAPDTTKIHLNKIAELKYNEDGSYALSSSDAWFDLKSDTMISLRYANIESPKESVLSLTQNEAGSTVYVLAGSAKVSNLAGVSTSLIKGQRISVSRLNAANKDLDLSTEKGMIDSYFKGSDWFIENQWHLVLQQEDSTISAEDTGSGWVLPPEKDAGLYVSFEKLRDEMSIETATLTINGTITSSEVSSLTLNNRQVSISQAEKTFSLENFPLTSSINDIVLKVYDNNKNILQKKVYTVYTSRTSSPSTVNDGSSTTVNTETPVEKTTAQNSQGSTTYSADATKFGFSEPSSSGKFSTTSSEVTLRGYTTAKGITAVQVNGFPLASFNGSTWRYHAFERFETLEEGTNQFKVDYFGEDGKIVYVDYFTLVKKAAGTVTPTSSSSGGAATGTSSVKEETSSSSESSLFQE